MTGSWGSKRLMIARYAIVSAIINFALCTGFAIADKESFLTASVVMGSILMFGQGLLLATSLAVAQLLSDKECLRFSRFKLVHIAIDHALVTFVACFVVYLSVPLKFKCVLWVILSTLYGALVAFCSYRTANRFARLPFFGMMFVSVGTPVAFVVADGFHGVLHSNWVSVAVALLWNIPMAGLIAAWLSSTDASDGERVRVHDDSPSS